MDASLIVQTGITKEEVLTGNQLSFNDGKLENEPPMKKLKQDNTEDEDNNSQLIQRDGEITDKRNEQNCDCNSPNANTQKPKGGTLHTQNGNEKDKISPPKQKRRKLTNEEKEILQKEKEEARLLREKLQLEKELERKKKEMEKEELKQKKEKERLEKQLEKELKEKEKQARKDLLEKERLEKQKKKEELQQAKEEEKKKREEERKQKDEEKRQKDEEKRQKEEEKRQKEEEEVRKKEKAKEAFRSFFIKKTPPKRVVHLGDGCELFAPFEIKSNMTMAPLHRTKGVKDKCTFDAAFTKQEERDLYLSQLESKLSDTKMKYVSSRSIKLIEKAIAKDEEVIILEDVNSSNKESPIQNTMRVKLLQFSENNRPAYYGTWRKRSKFISPKDPFKKDEDQLNYEIDSDDEWEEEEPGESLSEPENDEEDDEDDNEDEDDDGFFVPHGYLSDDEGIDNSDGEGKEKVDIKDQKLNRTNGFPFEKKGTMKQLRAICFGSSWFCSAENVPNFLTAYKVCSFVDVSLDVFETRQKEYANNKSSATGDSITHASRGSTPMKVPEEAMPFLIHHVHQNSMGLHRLITSFLEFWRNKQSVLESETRQQISKRQLERKILEIASRETFPENSKGCYIVQQSFLDKYDKELSSIKNIQISSHNTKNTSPKSQNAKNVRNNLYGISLSKNTNICVSDNRHHNNAAESGTTLQNDEHYSVCNKLKGNVNSEMIIS